MPFIGDSSKVVKLNSLNTELNPVIVVLLPDLLAENNIIFCVDV
jgi:hypothetical protein